jgi:hypothetical protein
MTIKTQLNELLDRKMDRQEFIKNIGMGLVAISGMGTALRLLAPKQHDATPNTHYGYGYGGSAYGGSDPVAKIN